MTSEYTNKTYSTVLQQYSIGNMYLNSPQFVLIRASKSYVRKVACWDSLLHELITAFLRNSRAWVYTTVSRDKISALNFHVHKQIFNAIFCNQKTEFIWNIILVIIAGK